MTDDETWMRCALEEAAKCLRSTPHSALLNPQSDDVPVGAICVFEGQIVGRGHNRREIDRDPIAHAEILALRAAAATLQTSHLGGVSLYVTLEPCPMCAGALWLSRVSRLIFGAWDDKAGACGSVFDIARDPRLNHRLQVRGGVLESECGALLREFFAARRAK
ncbi:MAG: tRNA adenosine(34) deaminase TadA [Armatimonadetes bacterium]|nr:tRNA adenosine(34) deaminase TadA [Armatimonadota bacterium]